MLREIVAFEWRYHTGAEANCQRSCWSGGHPLHTGANTIRIVTSTRPDSVILDPATTRLDRNTRDNVRPFGPNERSP